MTLDTARTVIDKIFNNVENDKVGIVISFFGGEPLLEFNLIKEIVAYTHSKKRKNKYIFFASTNGTLLTKENKDWFAANKKFFILSLSLDGAKETQDSNRSKSFDKIDVDFFLKNWPEQSVKMTLSEYSLPRLANNIKFLHQLGFKKIYGVNAEGEFDWSKENYLKILVPQLKELVEFYVENDTFELNQMLSKQLHICEIKEKERHKWCGTGTGCPFFDVDGKMYPCAFFTPMTFSEDKLYEIAKTDFSNDDNFIDEFCFENCYIYPICPNCVGANYLVNKTFKERDKRRCKITKLITLFIADLQAKRIMKNPKIYDDKTLYHTIEAIKKIRSFYLPEFEEYLK